MAISSIATTLAVPPSVPMLDVPKLDAPALGVSGLGAGLSSGAGPSAFQTVLAEAVDRVQSYQAASEVSISQFLDGADVDLHQVALSVQKAETSFELFAEVRNKVVQAYQEIMRLQV